MMAERPCTLRCHHGQVLCHPSIAARLRVAVPGYRRSSCAPWPWFAAGSPEVVDAIPAAVDVVQWDQRGAGRSYPLNDPKTLAPTLTIDRYRDDTIELIELLRKKYGKQKVFLLGHSWGSVVGLSVAAKRPDLLYAYIGMGQYIDPQAGERATYAWTLEQARKDNNAQR